ncbi:MAG TPA: nitrophenyl compound nitroreductase subunit ArsF family protein [Candidatus Omnitrophota bacterium]|nr:nitrophenyl compound nitroreductase subunit ArsF family protein [Candidatus Omnitrophota bacterium]
MRKIIQVLVVAAAISAGTFAFAQSGQQAKVIVYYFHGSFRCVTCTNMEKFAREAIETNFEDALASGKLEFKEINIEKRGNEHFVNDYKLYTKSLILSLVKDGKEIRSKNLDKIWELARNKKKFIEYVTAEVNALMKDTQ